MDTREAARRWADTWAEAWPSKDADAIVALQAEDGDHWASMFRRYRGRAGLREYVDESFAEESLPARTWFAEPRVDGDSASVEYWSLVHIGDRQLTISGCTVVRFDQSGLVTESRDYSHVEVGHRQPPEGLFK